MLGADALPSLGSTASGGKALVQDQIPFLSHIKSEVTIYTDKLQARNSIPTMFNSCNSADNAYGARNY